MTVMPGHLGGAQAKIKENYATAILLIVWHTD